MSAIEESATEVLVVGAGPVGLMATHELARRGVSVRLVDRAPRRSPESRALVMHARTLEIMDLAGLADSFVELGYPAPGLNIGLGRSSRPVSVDMRVLDSRYPCMLVLPQRQTEQILADALTSLGVEIQWGSTLSGIEQSATEVLASVRTDDGRTGRVRARYLIGSDGAHSSVRRLVHQPFEGKQLSELVLIGDVKADTEFVRSRITNFTSARGFLSILPFLGDYVRVFAVDFARQGHDRGDELSLEELQDTVDAIAPQRIPLSEPTWLTRYVAPSRGVRSTRVGRVFLAGDAAHAHSPAGGQGMNTGLQDAANLGWKLAMVLHGQAGDELLDSYDQERRPVHSMTRRETDRMFRTFTVRNPILKAVRDLAARLVVPRAPVQRRLAHNLSGLAITYRDTPRARAANTTKLPRAALRAGDRVPDLTLWTARRPLVRLHEILREPGYTLLVCATADRFGADRPRVAGLIRTVTDTAPAVRPCVVLDEGAVDPTDIGATVLVDITGRFAKTVGATHGSVLLARPDGYLAAHLIGLDPATVGTALHAWCSRNPLTHNEKG